MELEIIKKVAQEYNWFEFCHQENICMISFTKGISRINIYYSKMTVATCINHPIKGKTQLFRKNVWSIEELKKIFDNPRTHTGKGYYTK